MKKSWKSLAFSALALSFAFVTTSNVLASDMTSTSNPLEIEFLPEIGFEWKNLTPSQTPIFLPSSRVNAYESLMKYKLSLTGDTKTDVHKAYNVQNMSVITAEDLEQLFDGKLKGKGLKTIEVGQKYKIDPAFLAAIMMHESANGTSDAIHRLNNVGGIMYYEGGLRKFKSVDESIEELGALLDRLYLPNGKNTPETIQKWYCPVGASNDPTGLNVHWLKAVTYYWKEIRSYAVLNETDLPVVAQKD
ncbi:glucosaminidase domain-containing protein [Cytobacillus sp. FJAT-54145]|uniref:Glucosaminidase domain-containing protein n=1 Tax=Cytobacillus spartinae TaxID=3299023 RepID=A0ABW6KEM2_9BACI